MRTNVLERIKTVNVDSKVYLTLGSPVRCKANSPSNMFYVCRHARDTGEATGCGQDEEQDINIYMYYFIKEIPEKTTRVSETISGPTWLEGLGHEPPR